MSIDWYERYVLRMNEQYRKHLREYYNSFFVQLFILIDILKVQSIGEYGCGAGNCTRILYDNWNITNATWYLLDLDNRMLDLAKQNTVHMRSAYFFQHNILDDFLRIGEMDMIFSHGVLEHFADKDIHRILDLQLHRAKTVVHYVPTFGYDKPSFGDERLLPAEYWHKTFKPTDTYEFNNGKDIVMIWRRP